MAKKKAATKKTKTKVESKILFPSFLTAGVDGVENIGGSSNYVKLEQGKPQRLIMLTGVEPPPGEEPTTKNCMITYRQYSCWMDGLDRDAGEVSPIFPKISENVNEDPGAMLGLESEFVGYALVMDAKTMEEKFLLLKVSIYKQLLELEEALGESLRGQVVRILRKGLGSKTRYTVVVTGRTVEIEGEPQLDILDAVGPMNFDEIVATKLQPVKKHLRRHLKLKKWPFEYVDPNQFKANADDWGEGEGDGWDDDEEEFEDDEWDDEEELELEDDDDELEEDGDEEELDDEDDEDDEEEEPEEEPKKETKKKAAKKKAAEPVEEDDDDDEWEEEFE